MKFILIALIASVSAIKIDGVDAYLTHPIPVVPAVAAIKALAEPEAGAVTTDTLDRRVKRVADGDNARGGIGEAACHIHPGHSF